MSQICGCEDGNVIVRILEKENFGQWTEEGADDRESPQTRFFRAEGVLKDSDSGAPCGMLNSLPDIILYLLYQKLLVRN